MITGVLGGIAARSDDKTSLTADAIFQAGATLRGYATGAYSTPVFTQAVTTVSNSLGAANNYIVQIAALAGDANAIGPPS